MTARQALIFSLTAIGLAIGGLLFMAVSARAEAPVCATLEMRLNEVKQLGIAPSELLVIDDVAFINDYTKVSGLGIPDDSSPKQILLVTFDAKAYVGLVEQNGCIRYEVAIPIEVHMRALKAATAGV